MRLCLNDRKLMQRSERLGSALATTTRLLRRLDPRPAASNHPRLTVAVFAVATAAMLAGNVLATKGGILDDPITDTENAARRSNLYVQERKADGFDSGEAIPFVLRFPNGIHTPADLRRIRDFTESVKLKLGPAVVSAATISNYHDTGEELQDEPYVPADIPDDFDVEAWRSRVAADPAIYGIFVDRNFEWATVLRHLPLGYDDIVEFRLTAEFLESRKIPWWEWLYKTDIETDENVGVSDWVVGRGLIDQALMIDNLTLVSIGIALTLPLLMLVLRSLRQAVVGVVVVVILGFIWCRGSIGLLELAGFSIRERVYVLLAYTNCIVQGVSFVLHKFEGLHEVSSQPGAPQSLAARWRLATGNDHLIGATAVMSVFGFATLQTFQVITIREVGVLSAMSVAYQTLFTLLLLPAAHQLVGEGRERTGTRMPAAAQMVRKFFDGLVRGASALVLRASPRRVAWVAGVSTLALAFVAGALIWPGERLLVKTFPLKFIAGTVVERTARILNAPGGVGFAIRALLVEPADARTDLYDPAYLADAAAYQAKLARDPLVRETTSILDQVSQVSRESFHTPLPRDREEARAAFNIIEGNLDRGVARQLFFPHGVRIIATFDGDDSTRFSAVSAAAQSIANDFPSLRVSPFGKSALYGEVDHYISVGKPWNVFFSQFLVIAFCCIGVWINSRRLKVVKSQAMSPLLGGCIMSVPFVFASALIVLLMVALHIPLDSATAAITALAINASIDFSIYFADAYQEGDAVEGDHAGAVRFALANKGRVVLADMLLNAMCFFPLTFSRFVPVHELGWIMMVMLLACGFGTVVLMPALLVLAMPRTVPETPRAEDDDLLETVGAA